MHEQAVCTITATTLCSQVACVLSLILGLNCVFIIEAVSVVFCHCIVGGVFGLVT